MAKGDRIISLPVGDLSFSAHGNPSELAELEYFLSLPTTAALLRVVPVEDNAVARGVLPHAIPVAAPDAVLPPAFSGDQILNSSAAEWNRASYRRTADGFAEAGIDSMPCVVTQFSLSPLYQRTEEAYSPVKGDGSMGERQFPYQFEDKVTPVYSRGALPDGYLATERAAAYLKGGLDFDLFGTVALGRYTPRGLGALRIGIRDKSQGRADAERLTGLFGRQLMSPLSARFPGLLFAYLYVDRMDDSPYCCVVQAGRPIHQFYGLNQYSGRAFTDDRTKERYVDAHAALLRTVLDAYLNGVAQLPAADLSGFLRVGHGLRTISGVPGSIQVEVKGPPAARARLKAVRVGPCATAEVTAVTSKSPLPYDELMQRSFGYRWPSLTALALEQGAKVVATSLKGQLVTTVRNLLLQGIPFSQFSALDAMLASVTANGNLVFDARKLAVVARAVAGDQSGTLATVFAAYDTGQLMQGIALSAYLCLAEDPRLKRPPLLDTRDTLEEAHRLKKDAHVFYSAAPAPLNDIALREALVTVSGDISHVAWATPEYAGLLMIMRARQTAVMDATQAGFLRTLKNNVFGAQKLSPAPLILGECAPAGAFYRCHRSFDSSLLLLASGHPEGVRAAVQDGAPWSFVLASLVRTGAQMKEFSKEFGLARIPVVPTQKGPITASGQPVAMSESERLEGAGTESLWQSYRALRAEAQLRSKLGSLRANRGPLMGHRPALDIL